MKHNGESVELKYKSSVYERTEKNGGGFIIRQNILMKTSVDNDDDDTKTK
jgi:hypothetical protein